MNDPVVPVMTSHINTCVREKVLCLADVFGSRVGLSVLPSDQDVYLLKFIQTSLVTATGI